MTTTKKKKTPREKRIMIASIIVAGMIVAGSTFAWFTSRDEVTNRLTASAKYGVTITEDFDPPTNWLPGQEVSKDVYAVNTGNVAAFVKMELQGAFDIETEITGGQALPDASNTITNDTLRDKKLKTLNVGEGDQYKDSKAIQAGGFLAYRPTGSAFSVGKIDQNFAPDVSGLYLFRREIKVGDTTTYDFSGYYYDKESGRYYALVTAEDGIDVIRGSLAQYPSDDELAAVKLRSYESVVIPSNSDKLTWDYSDVANGKVNVTYQAGDAANPDKDMTVEINLVKDNLAGDTAAADKWQYIAADKAFYYTNDLEPSATSSQLVDSVTLSKNVKDTAFNEMKFDLTVKLNSVQVTQDENEKEQVVSAEDEFDIVPDGDVVYSGNEISAVKWKKSN